MAGLLTPAESGQRRPLRRSRYGCRNCKLRRLKCDEGKPSCKKCSSYGVLCNFSSNIADLQPIVADSERRLLVQKKADPHPQPPVSSAVWTADKHSSYQLNVKCQEFVSRYLGRSLISPEDPIMRQVNLNLLRLAFSNPYLMHASLGVALAYDRHLNMSLGCRRSLAECYHLSQSTSLLKRRLIEPIEAKDKDPIWGTAASLVILTFSSPDTFAPEESWPMNPSGPSALDWLSMNKGKMALWDTMNPLRPESLFSIMAPVFAQMESHYPERGMDGIPGWLASICLLDESSSAENNLYFDAAHGLAQVLDLPDADFTTGHTQPFMRSINGPFEDLLRKRDPVALLLLYIWYRKCSRSIWWIELRARAECPSICSYLQLYHTENGAIQHFLAENRFDTDHSFS